MAGTYYNESALRQKRGELGDATINADVDRSRRMVNAAGMVTGQWLVVR